MTQEATAQQVSQMIAMIQSNLDQAQIYSYGNAPEIQIDFHIPCEDENPLIADTLAALFPCIAKREATAFQAGPYVQLSLHREPSESDAASFLSETLKRIEQDSTMAEKIANQIVINREKELERVQARMARMEKLREKAKSKKVH